MASSFDGFKREIPHVIVLAILIIVLLVVITRFRVVHCSEIDKVGVNWCSFYCSFSGRSRIAIISGDTGMGNPDALKGLIEGYRIGTVVDPYPQSEMSYGIMKNYELIILERMNNVTPFQAQSLLSYAGGGGSILWIGDAATERYLSAQDIQDALAQNSSKPGYYEEFMKTFETEKSTKGFGPKLSNVVQANFQRIEDSPNITLQTTSRDSLISRGLFYHFSIGAKKATIVKPNTAYANVVAHYYGTKTCTASSPCPAILESKYAGGRIVYVAFPPEESNSKTLITNILDYLIIC